MSDDLGGSCENFSNSLWLYVVTDETLIVETAVWPTPFLINVFTALKGSVLIFYW